MSPQPTIKTPGRPVMRYPGAKWKIAPWIISFFPDHKVYVEPFCGTASLLFHKKPAITEVINDTNMQVVNVFRILRDPDKSRELKRLIKYTPFSREEYELCYEPTDDPIEQARRYICRASFSQRKGPLQKSGFDTRINPDGYAGRVNYHADYVNQVDLFTGRLKNVVVECRPAEIIIEQFDREEVLFFIDPPYLNVEKRYPDAFTEDDHIKLANQLNSLKAMAILCGYRSDLYKKLYEDRGWKVHSKSAYADGGHSRTECIWINPAAQNQKSQTELFK